MNLGVSKAVVSRVSLLFSDPFHDRYGQHLSKEEVEDLVAPEAESVHLVNEWLASHGVYEDGLTRSPAKDWVHIKIPVALAEEMLKTVCAFFSSYMPCSDVFYLRNTTFGRMMRPVPPSSARPLIASPNTFTSMSSSSSRQRCFRT